MPDATQDDWNQRNAAWLAAAFSHLSGCFDDTEEEAIVVERATPLDQVDAIAAIDKQGDTPLALNQIVGLFNLSEFERQLLLLTLATELDPEIATLCAEAQQAPDHYNATYSLAAALLADPHLDALAPTSALRRWELIHIEPASSLTLAPIRIDPRLLHFLCGHTFIDPSLGLHIEHVPTGPRTPPIDQAAVALATILDGARVEVVDLIGRADDRTSAAHDAADRLGLNVLELQPDRIPADTHERTRFVRHCERECLLTHSILMLNVQDAPADQPARATLEGFVDEFGLTVLIGWDRAPGLRHRRTSARTVISPPATTDVIALWRHELGLAADEALDGLDTLAAHFSLPTKRIRTIAQRVRTAHDEVTVAALWSTCRVEARGDLGELATRVEASSRSDDLVVTDQVRDTLHAIIHEVRQRATVFDTWGFRTSSQRGCGLTAMFSGPSGTGKTMAAEVIANELDLDLIVVDQSKIMDKYIGETSKNLGRVFDHAESSGAILLFDEADSLFGNRGQITDSKDRYASSDLSYLLTRIEQFGGLSILTTNRRDMLDEAFIRRLRHAATFELPDIDARREIWKRVFPSEAPLGDINFDRLAELDISGAIIRHIALSAAVAAATEGTVIEMRHVAAAAKREHRKHERSMTVDLEI